MDSDFPEPTQLLAELVTPAEAAALQGMSVHLFAYHAKRPGAPGPVFVGKGRHRFYKETDVKAWRPRKARNQQLKE